MNPVLAHLRRHVTLSESASSEFYTLIRSIAEHVSAGHELTEPDEPGKSLVLVDGWMIREVALPDGRRQVTSLFIPGDIFDLNTDLMAECGYSIRTITDSTVAEISHSQFAQLTARYADLSKALTWEQLEQLANQREWLVSLGQRSALERIAHFFCEVFWRLRAVNLTQGDECDMPLTQSVLAELTGMSEVHLNRSLQQLRALGLIELRRHRLRIIDSQALADCGSFDPAYLELHERV